MTITSLWRTQHPENPERDVETGSLGLPTSRTLPDNAASCGEDCSTGHLDGLAGSDLIMDFEFDYLQKQIFGVLNCG